MFELWLDVALGALWGLWLVMYLDRFYNKQVAAIYLCVFVFVQKSFKANRALASFINLLLLCLFLMIASALIGGVVQHWGLFVLGWCLGGGVYSVCFSLPKPEVRRRA
ncbi:hypothetical protein A1OO_04675 [Enterovibrio norvegicus FF-33]|uniref:MFS transporter n=1 Tax=Enterovibrio norvegicus FF-454 TaxID=1185651 RepID=A0A1E5CB59_9GAMM|nr:hypothetical protein [Enterovibrio norvegicus]OEE62754.1 hypothetical protein A1OK_19385 [Enterovibrio norvegicus FF-454]OEE70073.1 hypothetical protein A1OO_04675 [Enterovibrio norvegicus FF-33]OEE90225.1 hypothetical protein A1OQ_10690 [Enterovibrio norvegicus FF-162]